MSLPSHPAFAEAMSDLRVLNVEPSEYGECYGLVAARTNPRWWILPLSTGSQTRIGLDLFHPVSRSAQIIKSGASLACKMGLQRFAFQRGPRLAGVSEFAASFPGGKATSMGIFTGTDGPHRKTTIQFSDREARILGYAKLSRAAQVIPWIKTEAAILQKVAGLHLRTADVPRVLDLQQMDGATLLITDSRKGGNYSMPRELTQAHAAFIAEMAELTCTGDWQKHIDNLHTQFYDVRQVMGQRWQAQMGAALERLATGPALPVVLSHGDFTPWNSFLGNRLYVFDWEYSRRCALGHDVVHFIFANQRLEDAVSLEAAALNAITTVHPELGSTAASHSLLAYLCSQTLLFAQREYEGLRRIDEWTDCGRLLPIFDRLLKGASR